MLYKLTKKPLGTDAPRAYNYPRIELINILNLKEIPAFLNGP